MRAAISAAISIHMNASVIHAVWGWVDRSNVSSSMNHTRAATEQRIMKITQDTALLLPIGML